LEREKKKVSIRVTSRKKETASYAGKDRNDNKLKIEMEKKLIKCLSISTAVAKEETK
jgi:hypothetical protein